MKSILSICISNLTNICCALFMQYYVHLISCPEYRETFICSSAKTNSCTFMSTTVGVGASSSDVIILKLTLENQLCVCHFKGFSAFVICGDNGGCCRIQFYSKNSFQEKRKLFTRKLNAVIRNVNVELCLGWDIEHLYMKEKCFKMYNIIGQCINT